MYTSSLQENLANGLPVFSAATVAPPSMAQLQQALSATTASNSPSTYPREYNVKQPFISAETVTDGFCHLRVGLLQHLNQENCWPFV
jgi:hypothetical protein